MMKRVLAQALRDRENMYSYTSTGVEDMSQKEYQLLFHLADKLYAQEVARSKMSSLAFATLYDSEDKRFIVYSPTPKYTEGLRETLNSTYRKLGPS